MAEAVQSAALCGVIRATDTLRGSIAAEVSLTGTINAAAVASVDAYDGEYTVEPSLESDIVLETKNQRMRENVTVLQIPQYEVSNEAGGITFIIGKGED